MKQQSFQTKSSVRTSLALIMSALVASYCLMGCFTLSAFAAGDDSASSHTNTKATPLTSGDRASAPQSNEEQAVTAEGEPPADLSQTVPLVEEETHEESTATDNDLPQVEGQVPLSSEETSAKVGVIVSDGLRYEVNADGETVAVVGWQGAAPKGVLVIPAAITSGSDTYAVTSVVNDAFAHLSQVTSVALPKSLLAIGERAFLNCSALSSFTVDSNNEVFAAYDGMVFTKDFSQLLLFPGGMEGTAHIPDQAVSVPASVLSQGAKLSAVLVGEGNTALCSLDGVLYSKDQKTLIAYPKGAGESVVLSPECESIGEKAFAGCDTLSSLVAPGIVQTIAEDAFTDGAKENAVVALAPGDDYENRKTVWEQAGFSQFVEPATPGNSTSPEPEEESKKASGFQFTLLDDYTLSVAWTGVLGPDETLEIPSKGKVGEVFYRVSTIETGAFEGCTGIKSVVIPSTVISVGDAAFRGCTGLAAVSLPDSLQTIGKEAFKNTALESITIPASVSSVGEQAFAGNPSLSKIVVLASIDFVADSAIKGCAGVSLYCPWNESGEYAWNLGVVASGNHVLPYGITLPEEPLVLEVGESADLFEGSLCESPEGTELSFAYAATPLSVDAGQVTGKKEGVSDVVATLVLDGRELSRASRTVEVVAGTSTEVLSKEDGSSPAIPITNILAALGDENATETLVDSVSSPAPTSLASPNARAAVGETFTDSEGKLLFEVITGNIVKVCSYNSAAIVGALSIPATVTHNGTEYRVKQLWDRAFFSCTKLTSVTIPSSIPDVSSSAFEGCTNLTSVTMIGNDSEVPDISPLRNISYRAFYNCTSLTSITVNGFRINYIGAEAFYNCTKLRGVPNSDVVSTVGQSAFYNCTNLTSVPFSSRLSAIAAEAFRNCTKLTSVGIPSSVTSIGSYAFSNTGLTSVNFPDTVTTWGDSVFANCKRLTSAKIPTKVSNASTYLFANCPALNSVTIPNTLSFIPANTFQNCTALTSVALPNSVKRIEASAFVNCRLSSITFPNSVGYIGNSAFYGNALKTIKFGTGMSSVQATAFDANPLTDIYDTNASIKSAAINVDRSKVTVHLPNNATTLQMWKTAGFTKFDASFTVSFNAQGGSPTPASRLVKYGATTAAPANPAKTGYTFTGWYTAASGGARWDFASNTNSGPMTLYAQWTPTKYTLSFNANGGSPIPANQSVAYKAKATAPAVPAKTGYTFGGWYKESALTNVWNFNTDTMPASNVVLYAKWNINTYTVTFADYDNTVISTTTYNHGAAIKKPVDPTRASTAEFDYAFAGWSPAVPATCTSTATYKATYTQTKRSYSVSFESDGGSAVDAQSIEYGSTVSQPADPQKTGYTFVGWFSDSALTKPYNFDTPVTGELTLYAKWSLRISCEVPASATVLIDASGNVTESSVQQFTSTAVAPVRVTGVTSAMGAGASSLFLDVNTRDGVKVTLTPSGKTSVSLGLADTLNNLPAKDFEIPANGALSLTFGIELPASVSMGYSEELRQVASLSYTVAAVEGS